MSLRRHDTQLANDIPVTTDQCVFTVYLLATTCGRLQITNILFSLGDVYRMRGAQSFATEH